MGTGLLSRMTHKSRVRTGTQACCRPVQSVHTVPVFLRAVGTDTAPALHPRRGAVLRLACVLKRYLLRGVTDGAACWRPRWGQEEKKARD